MVGVWFEWINKYLYIHASASTSNALRVSGAAGGSLSGLVGAIAADKDAKARPFRG